MVAKQAYPIDVGLSESEYRYQGQVACPYCGSHNTTVSSLDDFHVMPTGTGYLSVNALCFDCVKAFTMCYDFEYELKRKWFY